MIDAILFGEFANAVGEEWQPSPVFEDIGEGLSYMDEQERAAIAEMEEEARQRMEADAQDPRKQNYFMRTDTNTVVKDEQEYVRCQLKGVQMRVIPYGHALQLLKEEEARKRQRQKAKRKKKDAKASKKRNRR